MIKSIKIPRFTKEQEEYFLEHERLVSLIDEDEKIGGLDMEYKWEDDKEAWDYLQRHGFKHQHGVILSPQRRVTRKEDSAIVYLHTEWDWGYEGDFV